MQVFDFDLDGKQDVLTGMNRSRGQVLDLKEWSVYIFLNRGVDQWEKFEITREGIYNGQVFDLEGDGDLDIFRLPTHDDSTFEVLINQIK